MAREAKARRPGALMSGAHDQEAQRTQNRRALALTLALTALVGRLFGISV